MTYFYWSGQNFDFGHYLAVASASLHSDRVLVLVDEHPRSNEYFRNLAKLPGVSVEPIRTRDLLSDEHARLYRRMRFVQHRSDLICFSVLHEFGGVFLDTDTLTCEKVENLPQPLIFRHDEIIHVGVLGLRRRCWLARAMLDAILQLGENELSDYRSIVRLWSRTVLGSDRVPAFAETSRCFPLHWSEWERIFTDPSLVELGNHIWILHHYGFFSRRYTATLNRRWLENHSSLFSRLALPLLDELEIMTGLHLSPT